MTVIKFNRENKEQQNIPDHKKLEYMINDLNLYTNAPSGSDGKLWLLNNRLSDHMKEIKRLSELLYLDVPPWVKDYYSTIDIDF